MAIKVNVVTPAKNRVSINTRGNLSLPSKLKELIDVDASDADSNETLVYDEVSGKFIVKELPVINGGTF